MTKAHTLKVSVEAYGSVNTIYPALIENGEELILIDCGYIGCLPAIEEAIKTAGFSPEDLTAVVITHHDHDHMGALAALKEKYPHVKVLCHEAEAPYVSGEIKSLRLSQAEARQPTLTEEEKAFGLSYIGLLSRVVPVAVDRTLKDGETFWGCVAVHTPGHMPGHLAVYVSEPQAMITGDAMSMDDGIPAMANPKFTLDMAEARRSIEKMMKYDIKTLICYHGGAFEGDVHAAMQKVVDEN